MERPDGWPERFILFPRLERVGAFLGRHIFHEPTPAQSDHYRPPEEVAEVYVLPFVLNANHHDVEDPGWPPEAA